MINHVSYGEAAALGNWCHRDPGFGFRVESHQAIWLDSRFSQPNPAAIVGRHRVRKRLRGGGQGKFANCSRPRIEPAEHSAHVVAVPEDPVRGDSDAAWPR